MGVMQNIDWAAVGNWFVGIPLRITIIVVLAIVLRWLVHRALRGMENKALARGAANQQSRVDRLVTDVTGVHAARRKQRAQTTASVLRSLSSLVIFTLAGLMVLAELGLPLGPLVAGAGIGGVALGFGAQSLVKDFLSGIFMIVEDQYGVGDWVDLGEVSGSVEEVTLRVTRIRDWQGTVWFVRNGEILRVGNLSQGWAMAIVDFPLAYDADPSEAIPILTRVAEEAYAEPEWADVLLETPNVVGVESMTPGVVQLRILGKTKANQQWGIQRELRKRGKEALDDAGIKGAPPVVSNP